MMLLENNLALGQIFPIIILIILFALETGVAIIQTYVFIILSCLYLADGL